MENLKSIAAYTASITTEAIGTQTLYLTKSSRTSMTLEKVNDIFKNLTQDKLNQVYGKIYELAKMKDPTVHGSKWGEIHALDDLERTTKALHRLGHLGEEGICPIKALGYTIGEGGLGSQYFSLSEKADKNPPRGHIGYVNGMGVPSLEHAGRDVVSFSNRYADGNNIHCVYHSTHQTKPSGDFLGFLVDAIRMKAVDGGSYTKTSYLIAQQWIDFFIENPDSNYLQIAHSEGAAHVAAALRLLKQIRPDLISKVRVLNFCPAHIILSEDYTGLQVKNFVKKEDSAINPWAKSIHRIDSSRDIILIRHSTDHPHNHLSSDYVEVGKPFVKNFMQTGNLYL